ncbi:MAG: hypothetical protein ABIP53_03895 [Candidatus Limnocylindrales bacterium]
MAHDYQDGEHSEEWPAQDLPGADPNTEIENAESETAQAVENVEDAANAMNGEGVAPSADSGMVSFAADDSDAPVSLGEDVGTIGDANGEMSEEAADSTDRDRGDDDGMPFYAASADATADDDAADGADDDEADAQAAADNLELNNEGARDIDATNVSITRGGARDIDATTVTINQGGAARIRADHLSISQGGVGLARTDELTLHEGGTAFAVVADSATFDRESSVFMLIAGSTNGDVRPVFDWRAAAAFGAAFGLVLSLLRRGRR